MIDFFSTDCPQLYMKLVKMKRATSYSMMDEINVSRAKIPKLEEELADLSD